MSKSYNYQATYFVTSAPDFNHLPHDSGIEIAFAGRSNAGKSSALNTLVNQKHLARTSKMPGRTQLINLFEVEPGIRLVDLPGYGYAEVSKKTKHKWQNTLSEYLKNRTNLKGLVLLIDIRHPTQHFDKKIIKWMSGINVPVLILLTKADKITFDAQKIRLNQIQKTSPIFMNNLDIEVFSSLKKQGLKKLRKKLDTWFSSP